MVMRHRYVELITAAATTGATFNYFFSANGLYDPNITGTGHQPLYFDQMTAVYDHYTCLRSKIKFEVLGSAAYRGAVFVSDDTSVPASAQAIAEMPSASGLRLVPASTFKSSVFTKSWDAKQYFGGDILDNDNLQGTVAANPAEQSYFVFVGSAADGTSTVNFQITAEIEYEVQWDELKQTTQS